MKRKKRPLKPRVTANYSKVNANIPVTDEQREWLRVNYPKYFKKRSIIAEYLGLSRYHANLVLLQEGIAKEG